MFIIVHFSYEIHQNRAISMSQSVCVSYEKSMSIFLFHCRFIWGRVQGQICCVMLIYLFLLMELSQSEYIVVQYIQ